MRLILIAAFLLVGCDRAADVGKTRPSTAEEEGALETIPPTDAIGQPPPIFAAPYNLPAYAPIYPDATIENSNATAALGEPGGLVTFIASAAPEAVADFYRQRLNSAGMGAVSDAESSGARMLAASRGSSERVEIHIAPAPQGARVTIAYALPAE